MILSAQTEPQIANEINKRGINSIAEVNAELAKRDRADTRGVVFMFAKTVLASIKEKWAE